MKIKFIQIFIAFSLNASCLYAQYWVVNNGGNIVISGAGNYLVLQSGSYLNKTNATSGLSGTINSSGKITLTGNWTNNATDPSNVVFTNLSSAGIVTFNGSTTQTIGGTRPTTFPNLTINNTVAAGTDAISLGITGNTIGTSTTGILTLTNGQVNLNGYSLIIASSSPAAITRTNGYILSNSLDKSFSNILQWNIGTSSIGHVFPFGFYNGSIQYIPLTFTLSGGGNCGNILASTYPADPGNSGNASTVYANRPNVVTSLKGIYTGSGNPADAANLVRRFWYVNATTNPIGTASITCVYANNEEPINGEQAGLNNMVLQNYNETLNSWQPPSAGITSDPTTNAVTISSVTALDNTSRIWTISREDNPLPIKLLSFNAVCNDDKVSLNWATASEINNNYFTIERSKDAVTWEVVTTTPGAGNSNTLLYYSATDNQPYSGYSYYRLKQTDYNGDYTYSDIRSSSCEKEVNYLVTLYPNPASNNLNLQMNIPESTEIEVKIINAMGQDLKFENFHIGQGNNIVSMDISALKPAIYILQIIPANKDYQNSNMLFIKKN
jgi:hypothetical protein